MHNAMNVLFVCFFSRWNICKFIKWVFISQESEISFPDVAKFQNTLHFHKTLSVIHK